MSIQHVKTLLGVDNERVDIVYQQIEKRLLSRLKRSKQDIDTIPDELDYIVIECAIARYNRIGSEGMASESMDGHSATYADVELSNYENDIKEYLKENDTRYRRGKVRFL